MGLFDTVRCDYPLPDPQHQSLEFQTKSLDCLLDAYTITRDGLLVRHARRSTEPALLQDVEWPIHGDVRIYESLPSEGDDEWEWVEYLVRFTRGQVEWVRRVPGPVGLESEATPPASGVEAVGAVKGVEAGARPPTGAANPELDGRRLTADEFRALAPEKLELLDGHVPGEEDLLRLLLTSVGLRRAAALVGRDRWDRATAGE